MKPDENHALSGAWDYSLFSAILNRRARRFGLGMEIAEGPNHYKSAETPVPLTQLEHSMLVLAGVGVSGINLSDMPFTGNLGGATTMMHFAGRTYPSPCASHGTELFYTNDDGVFLVKFRDFKPEDMRLYDSLPPAERIIQVVSDQTIRLDEGRMDIARSTDALSSFNIWNTNRPGTTLYMPVTDLSWIFINLLLTNTHVSRRLNIVDDRNENRPAGTAKWVERGVLRDDRSMSITAFDQALITVATAECSIVAHNIHLASQALGLGALTYAGYTANVILGATDLCRGLGFRFVDTPLGPNPVGRDGAFQSLQPPYLRDVGEAVDLVVAEKFGGDGTFAANETDTSPFRDQDELSRQVEHYSEDQVECVKDICRYFIETYGRIPPTIETMRMPIWAQVQHLDLGFYDKFSKPGAYTETQAQHMRIWHD